MRKPVQIVTGAIGEPYGDEGKGTEEVIGHTIYALCDDGSIWRLYNDGWIRLSDIPQDEPEQPATSPDVVEALRPLTPEELDKADLHCDDMVLIELPIKDVTVIAWCRFVFKTSDLAFVTGVLEDNGNVQYVDLHMGQEGDTVLLDYVKRDGPRFPVREPRQEEPR